MKKTLLLLVCAFTLTRSFAQPANEQQAIKNLCGCFEVDFKYAETFAADTAYKYYPRYKASGLEWVVAEESNPNKFVLQHLLIVGDNMIVKHWREDWEYEKADWLVFNHDATWKQVSGAKDKVKGQWTQTVWEVDDAPRYQGSSKWVANNGKYYWENTADAPLPRREYTKRNDYNVMQRNNRIVITETGWTHEQDNKKIIRKDGGADVYIAEEKGYNIYKKTDDSKCKQAMAYWEKHKQFWVTVRQAWQEALKDKTVIHVATKADGMLLYEQFDDLEKLALTGDQLKDKVKGLLSKYVEKNDAKQLAAK
ncbi:MAG: hypothetical protein QM726_25125 [Chitinophagaceae bacterium]